MATPVPPKTPGVLAEQMLQLLRNCGQGRASQVDAIKMLASVYNLKVVSNFAPQGGVNAAPSQPKVKKEPPAKKIRSPEEKGLLDELEITKGEIKLTGRELPDEHPLIIKRDAALRRLRLFRAKGKKARAGQAVPLPSPSVPSGSEVDSGGGSTIVFLEPEKSADSQRESAEDSKTA